MIQLEGMSLIMAYKGRDRQRNSERVLEPLKGEAERALRLRELLEELAEINAQGVPVIVEGKRDRAALEALGFKGEIITYNQGCGVHDFCEGILGSFKAVILLMDWDREGDSLQGKIGRELEGHWEEFRRFREVLRKMCQKEVKDVEGLPALLRRLETGVVEETLIDTEDQSKGESS
jgi:5S rRNA maturation endonuclease (ribonuclease M5)